MLITILYSLLTLLVCSPKDGDSNKPLKYEELPSSTSSLSLDRVNGSTVRRDAEKIIDENDLNLWEITVLDTFLIKTFQASGNDIVRFNINDRSGMDDAVIVDVHTQVLSGSQTKVEEGERAVVSVTSYEQRGDQNSNSITNKTINTVSIKDQVKSETIRAMFRVCATVTIKLNGAIDGNKTINKTFIYHTTGSYIKTQ